MIRPRTEQTNDRRDLNWKVNIRKTKLKKFILQKTTVG